METEKTELQNGLGYVYEQDGLTDNQMKKLLKRAELRLQGHNPDLHLPEVISDNFTPHTPYKLPTLNTGTMAKPYVAANRGVARADATRLLSSNDRRLSEQSRRVEDPMEVKDKIAKKKQATAGSEWFNLPRTNLTAHMRRDLQLLKMRSVLDPKRHYKKENAKAKAPEFSQAGTLIEGPTEFFSSRLLNRDRKKTFVDEVLTVEDSTGRFKSKYNDIQISKTSGKKAYYKNLGAKRSSQNRER